MKNRIKNYSTIQKLSCMLFCKNRKRNKVLEKLGTLILLMLYSIFVFFFFLKEYIFNI